MNQRRSFGRRGFNRKNPIPQLKEYEMTRMTRLFGIQLHVTRAEVLTWITTWMEEFEVEWRECPLNISDKKAGLTSDLKALLKKDRDLRIVILEKPVPKSLVVDMDFFSNSTINRAFFDVGRQSRNQLEESHLTGSATEPFLSLAKYVKKRTKSGVRLKCDGSFYKSHLYSDSARELWESGTKIIDLVGQELDLIAEAKKS